MAIVFSQVIYNITPGYVHTASKNDVFFFIMFTNLVSAFVPASERSFFYFFTAPGRLCRAEDRCAADGYPCCASEMAEVH